MIVLPQILRAFFLKKLWNPTLADLETLGCSCCSFLQWISKNPGTRQWLQPFLLRMFDVWLLFPERIEFSDSQCVFFLGVFYWNRCTRYTGFFWTFLWFAIHFHDIVYSSFRSVWWKVSEKHVDEYACSLGLTSSESCKGLKICFCKAWLGVLQFSGSSQRMTPLKTNMSPENQWLEDVPFLGTC